jgi:DNA-binding winged helix-turn-helix (wHTH) protein
MNQPKDPFFYPATPETIHSYASKIFAPIIRGECVTTVWVPMAGRRKWNKFIIENINLFEKEIPNYDKYILAYVEPLDLTEESVTGYLKLMGNTLVSVVQDKSLITDSELQKFITLFNQESIGYSQLLDLLRQFILLLTSSGRELIFFLGEFDELSFANKIFFNNLKSLWSKLYPRLHYIFLMIKVPDTQDYYYSWSELGEVILQNLVYEHLRQGEDVTRLISEFSSEYKTPISDTNLKTIIEVCGGHPYSIKVAIRILRDNASMDSTDYRKNLTDNFELRSIATGIYEKRSENEKKLLAMIVQDQPLLQEENKTLAILLALGLVEKNGDQLTLYSELFAQSIKRTAHKIENDGVNKTLSFDERTGGILFGGKTVEESFTRQEYSILALFLKNPGKVLTRDELGDVLWGESNYEKYSDWAIDQLMSKLRKKLKEIGVDIEIATLRGRGYKIIQ